MRALSSDNNISAEKHSQSLELDYVSWNVVRKQNNLQILLTGYGKHFTLHGKHKGLPS